MKTKEFKVVVRTYNNVKANVEGLEKHFNCIIENPIDLAKYVNMWLYSSDCINDKFDEELNNQYFNHCKRLAKRYTQDDNAYVSFGFSEDNWVMEVSVSKSF